MAAATAKASGVLSFAAVLKEQLSPPAYARCLAALQPATRAIIEKPPMAMSWIDRDAFDDLLSVAWEHAVAHSEDGIADLGRRQTLHDMKTVYKVLMHITSTITVIRKASTIYSTYTKSGKMTAREIDAHHAEISVEDPSNTLAHFWAYQRGAILGVLEAAGTKNPVVALVAGGGTSLRAVYAISWG